MLSDADSFHSANDSDCSSNEESFCSVTDTLDELVRSTFQQHLSRLFNVCHINAQSIPSHHNDLLVTFTNTNVHAILVSETWLKPNLPSTSYSLPGFILIRNDRVERRGGGVAIYLRSDFPYKILCNSHSNNTTTAEFLFLEVNVTGVKIVLGVVYCPPAVNYFSSLESILESLGSEYSHHVIMGDFNTDLLDPQSHRSLKLLQIIESACLHVLPLQATHHNTEGVDTWLDLILTCNPSLVRSHGQYLAPCFSRHDLIFLSYNLKPPKVHPKVLHLRSFGRMDIKKLGIDASNINWRPLYDAASMDEKVNFFNETITKLYDEHAPIRKVRLKYAPAPWMSEGIREAMRCRDKSFRKFKKARSDENWSLFKAARNRCNQMVRNAKRRHVLSNIDCSSPANIWRFLGTLGIGKQRSLCSGEAIGLNDINLHFSSTAPLNHQAERRTVEYIAHLPKPNINLFQFSPVTSDAIKKIILSIKSNSVGYDNISRRMILPILDHLLPAVSHLINFSLQSGFFPSLWRYAFVIPLPKIPNPTIPAHFRPISILPFLSKVLEACVQKQLSHFVYQNNLLSPLQSGFRPGHSTTSALLKVTGDIRMGVEDAKVTVLALVDFSNAFNTVSHEILLSILSHLMVSSEALDWFSSYIRGRQQSVRFDDNSSNWCNLHAGVPQGGILSPLLFSIFINLITKDLQCSYHLYADDLQLYSQASVDDIHDAIANVNQDLDRIKSWSLRFGLNVNPSKCQALIIGSNRMVGKLDFNSLPPINFDGLLIPFSSSVKDLGLWIDSTLSWQAQATSVSKRVTNTLRAFYRLKNFLPLATRVMLVQTLIFPLIDYGDVCYFDLNADLLNKYDRLLNNCIRFIYNLRKYDHISVFRAKLRWLPIRQRRHMRALTTLFSILNSPNSPSYLSSFFQYLCDSHNKNLRSSTNRLLLCLSHSTEIIHSSFFIQSVLLWNALPLEIRMSTNRFVFKVKVRAFLLDELAKSSQ